jgi:hypothetical protein
VRKQLVKRLTVVYHYGANLGVVPRFVPA